MNQLTRVLSALSLQPTIQNTLLVRCLSVSHVLERNSKRAPWFAKPPLRIKKLVHYEGEYTTDPLPMERFGGRNEAGRVICRRGGGDKRMYYMVDFTRNGNEDGTPVEERVLEIVDDMNRSAKLALVARDEQKRYIIATENMKPGDLIRASSVIPRTPVKAIEGDAHPLGALPTGTLVNCVQKYPGKDFTGKVAAAAGTSALLVKKLDGRCIVKLPSKLEINLDERCMATVGRVSNVDHNKFQYGKAGAKRWAGYRPRSGWWQRKDARFGKKPKKIKPVKVYTEPPKSETPKTELQIIEGKIPVKGDKRDVSFLINFPRTYEANYANKIAYKK